MSTDPRFTVAMCFTVFSGTAQYAAIPFFVSGAGIVSVFLSTLLMSLRFCFYTLNMMEYKPKSKAAGIISIAGLTDEGFGVLSTLPEEQREPLFLKIVILSVSYWTFSAIVGVLLGDSVAGLIPNLDFALPCLFAILAYEQYKNQKQWKPVVIALISFLLARQISETGILLAAILIAGAVVILLPQSFSKEVKNEHK